MTHAEDVLSHRGEGGWFVLAEHPPQLGGSTPEFAEHLLARMDLSRPVACLVLGLEGMPGLGTMLEEVEGLLGVQPVLLDASQPPPAELDRVSLLILAGGEAEAWVQVLQDSRLGEQTLSALGSGAIVLAIGAAAAALGSSVQLKEHPSLEDGLGWLTGAIVLPGIRDPAEVEAVRRQLELKPKAYALGIAGSSLVAIGPSGEIEIWGETKPTIMLGSGWSTP